MHAVFAPFVIIICERKIKVAKKETKSRKNQLFVEITARQRAVEYRRAADKQAEADEKIFRDRTKGIFGVDGIDKRRFYVRDTEPQKSAKKKREQGVEKLQGLWRYFYKSARERSFLFWLLHNPPP